MKIFKNLLAAFVLCCALLIPANIANAESIGVVDVEKIYSNYILAQDVLSDAKIQEAELQKFIADAQKKIKKETSPVSRKNIEEKLTKQFQEKREKASIAQRAKGKQVQDNILKAINDVSKEKKVSVVLEKTVVIVGGIDLTDSILAKLNSKK